MIKKSFTKRHWPNGINNYMLLIIKTPAVFALERRETKAPPGTAIVIPPHIPYYYPNGEYMDLSAAFHQKDAEDPYTLYQSTLQGIRIAMQSSLYDPLSADDAAKQIGISKSHFQHLYTQQFGISFQQNYIQMRINYAKDLLETSSLSMEQIAEICGYSSEVHFYRQFKSCVEMTPAKYRKHFHNQM